MRPDRHRRRLAVSLAPLLLLAALPGCGGCGRGCAGAGSSHEGAAAPEAPPAGSASDDPAPRAGYGRVVGRVSAEAGPTLDAPPPEGCPPAPRPAWEGEDGGLAGAVVLLRAAPRPAAAPAPPALSAPAPREVPLAVVGCRLAPPAVALRAGDTLVVTNRDDRFHALQIAYVDGAQERPQQTIALAPLEAGVRYPVAVAGLYSLRSRQWPALAGSMVVPREGELAAATGTDGSFALDDLPPGSHDATIAHHALPARATTVEVVEGETAALTATLTPARSPD